MSLLGHRPPRIGHVSTTILTRKLFVLFHDVVCAATQRRRSSAIVLRVHMLSGILISPLLRTSCAAILVFPPHIFRSRRCEQPNPYKILGVADIPHAKSSVWTRPFAPGVRCLILTMEAISVTRSDSSTGATYRHKPVTGPQCVLSHPRSRWSHSC